MNVKRYFRLKQQQIRGGTSPKTELENLQVIFAESVRAITFDEMCAFFGLDPVDYTTLAKMDNIRQSAIEAGKRLVK